MTTATLAPLGEYEVEDEAFALEDEREAYHEDEDESEEFFGALASLASRALSNPTLRRVGLGAARAAIQAGGRALGEQTGGASNQVAGYLQGLLPQSEMEGEDEQFVDPFQRIYPNRPLMEHIGHVAAETEDEDEAEALIGSLVPLAARAAPALARATPHLVNAMSTVGRQLRANPSTRPLVRALPAILNRAAQQVNRQAAAGHRITPQRAVQTLARHAARTLGNPRQLVNDYRRSQRLEHRHHVQHQGSTLRTTGGAPSHARRAGYRYPPGHPWYRYGGRRQYTGAAPGYGSYAPAAGRPVTHRHPEHPHPHAHPVPHTHAGGPAPGRRYAPPPGAPAPIHAGPGTGTWTCTCQWV